ncbi:MAG: peptide deformylase [Bacteroidales bacterium]|nr:peptide deformylase [Bacteroidales bacterium]
MVYPIYIYGHPVLRKISDDIQKDYEDLDKLIDNMYETMHKAEGIGLAAPQIGKSIRVFIVDGTGVADDEPELADFKKVFINADIIETSGEIVPMNEGCLSIPKIREDVNRESRIRVKYYDENWEFHDEVIEGFKARIIQHEYDHLDGILFTDRMSPIRKRLLKSKLSGLSRGKFEVDYRTVLPKHKIK